MNGTVRAKGKNKWQLIISLGYDENKKQRRKFKTVFAKNKTAAEKMLPGFYLENKKQLITNHQITFGEFVHYWKLRHCKNLSITTNTNNYKMLDNRILPAFAERLLTTINANDIINLINCVGAPNARLDNKKKLQLAPTTVQKYLKLLHLIFNKAVEWKYMSNNPCDEVPRDLLDNIEGQHKHYPIWTKEELSKFLQILEREQENYHFIKNKLIFYIALVTGARRGEIFALSWDMIDMEQKTIHITKSVKYINGSTVAEIGKPKTKSSLRDVYFDDYTKNLFKTYSSLQNQWLKSRNASNPNRYLFVSTTLTSGQETRIADGKSFYLWLKHACVKNDLPPIAVHSIRAMCATFSLSNGMPLNLVQSMLGHTSISTTNIYLHDVYDQRKDFNDIVAHKFQLMRKPTEE